jgi:hypothetical protein
MKEYGWSRSIAPLIPNLNTRWKRVVNFTLLAVYPIYLWGKNAWYPLNGRLGGPQSQPGHFAEDTKNMFLQGIKHQIIQRVA